MLSTKSIRDLCSPAAECLSDKARLDSFVSTGLEAATEIDRPRLALNEIARQQLTSETDECGDYDYAFDCVVAVARAALNGTKHRSSHGPLSQV